MSDDKQGWLQILRTNRTEERARRRIENYEARLNVGQNGAPLESALKGMAERHAAANERVRRVRAQTKASLDKQGVPLVTHPFYFRYACKLSKMIDKARGEQVNRVEARLVVMTWVQRGLDRDVLLRIARELFELEIEDK